MTAAVDLTDLDMRAREVLCAEFAPGCNQFRQVRSSDYNV